jgi:hypothetical protein
MTVALTVQESTYAQRQLVAGAAVLARRAGYDVQIGCIGGAADWAHATLEVPLRNGRRLVLHAMGETLGLHGDEAADEGADPEVWHVLVRDADGEIMTFDRNDAYGCWCIVWALKAGLDPQAAVFLLQVVLDDGPLLEQFGLAS